MEDIAAPACVRLLVPKLDDLVLQRNRWHVQMIPTALSHEVAGKIVLVQALHDRNDRARLLVIEPRDECAAIPIDHALPCWLRMDFVGVEGIVDDDQIGASPGERSSDRGRVSAPPLGRDELETGFPRPSQRGKERRVPLGADDHPKLSMEFGGEVARIACHDHAACRIVAEQPSDIRNRDADRFERARRLVDQQAPALARVDPYQLMGDRIHMPVVKIGFAGRDGRKDLADEERQLSAQDGPQHPIHRGSPRSPQRRPASQ